MKLFYQVYPDNLESDHEVNDLRPPLLIIPGLFGSTVNWRSIAREIGQTYPVWVIDQRNHGRSSHANSQTYQDMVDDLLEFVDQHNLESIIPCGHSMGGKVAMCFSLLHPERVEKLAVLDIAPVTYQHSHAPFLEQLMRIDLATLDSRSSADRALRTAIPDTGTRLFLLQNLVGSPGKYHWRINLPVLHQYMPELVSFPIDLLMTLQPFDEKVIFIRGEQSDYLLPEHHSVVLKLFKHAQFETIENAGHWLHAEQPKAVIAALQRFLKAG